MDKTLKTIKMKKNQRPPHNIYIIKYTHTHKHTHT